MTRLRNVTTDVTISVADDKADRFGSDYVPAEAVPSDTKPSKKPSSKK